ncbi:MAG: DUF6331 family protein [Gemmataceae bacterium]
MVDVSVEVPSPLQECFLHCEVECARECCGIDAISSDPGLIAAWARQAGPAAVADAQRQLADLISIVEDRTHKVSSLFLNHYTCHEAARIQLLDFLAAFRTGLASIAELGAAADRGGM